jgi:hypothetical protein
MPVVRFPDGASPPPRGPAVLDDPALDPAVRLQHILDALQRAEEEWQALQTHADDLDPVDEADLLESVRKDVRAAYRRWYEISQQAAQMAEQVRRTALELRAAQDWEGQRTQLLRKLQAQFEGGPHYDLLCERVSGLHVRLQQMEASGRDFSPAEHATLNAQLLGYVNQLQKYTEALKSESISKEAQSVAESILQIVEKHCATSYPELWLHVMRDVRASLEAA